MLLSPRLTLRWLELVGGVTQLAVGGAPFVVVRSCRMFLADVERSVARFHRIAWVVLAYTVFVILFGAWVRITGSGAGCGQHWPTCQGEVVHLPQSIETVIELTHRLTSGLDLIAVLVLLGLAIRRFPRGSLVRWGAWLSLVFIITEALLGARLVLLGLVGLNDSTPRAVMMALHLTNTSLLTGAMAVAVWASGEGKDRRLRWPGTAGWLLVGALAATLIVSGAGAVTALGDTLYPVTDSAQAVRDGLTTQGNTVHLLQRMRIVHPALSVAFGLGLFYLCGWLRERNPNRSVIRWTWIVTVLVAIQLGAGLANIALSAPGWMQILHLFLAVALWIALVLMTLGGLSEPKAAG